MKNLLILLTACLCLSMADTSFAETSIKPSHFHELFEEIVDIVEENFYNPEQIAQDFPAILTRYRAKLTKASTPESFSKLANSMLGELKASHTYYLTPDDREYYQLGALFFKIPEIGSLFEGTEVRYPSVGIITQSLGQRVFISAVLAGGAAEKAGLLGGDEIVSVNGKPFTPVASIRQFIGKDVTYKIRRHAGAKPFTVIMRPMLANPKQEMLDAQKASVRVIERSKKRIGYIHMYSYAGEEYHQELLNAVVWGELKSADALIIDMRYGLGGAWPYYLNLFNRKIPVFSIKRRDGTKDVIDSQWRKPAAYLVNGFSRSGKELLAFGARKYHLATVIGERTAGQTLGGRLFPLSNGDMLFLAVQSCRIDGVDLEGLGVTPDIEVPFDIRYSAGHDPQLEKAIEHLSEQLVNHPSRDS